MNNILLIFKQKVRLIAGITIAAFLCFASGFLLHRHLLRDLLNENQQLKKQLSQATKAFEELSQNHTSLQMDRDNVLIQTKRLIVDSNRMTDLEKTHEGLSKDFKALSKRKDQLLWDVEKLKEKHAQTNEQLEIARDTIAKLDARTKELDVLTKSQQQKLDEKVEKAPEYRQLKNEFDRLKSESQDLDQEKKRLLKAIEAQKAELEEMKIYRQKYEEATVQIDALNEKNKQLAKDLKNAPKKFTHMANENQTLIQETADMHYNLGVFYAEQKRYDRAREEFKKAVDLKPEHSKAHYNLGYLYSQYYEDHEHAISHFRKYLGITPNDESADSVRNYLITQETYDAKVLKA